MRKRDANLDLLRATAILMVVFYHISQRWPVPRPWLRQFTDFGEYGVDLFFVLSGWLIGGLLWREQLTFGNVQIGRFICRRSLRTLPPYGAGLVLAFLGVFLTRNETFNWHYLLFLQNYLDKIPFFLVSWSLCVEEHFYLFMPLIAAFLLSRQPTRISFFLLVFSFFPMIFRIFTLRETVEPFGFYYTATHLRFEGLMLGVWASFIQISRPDLWRRWQPNAQWMAFPISVLLIGVLFSSEGVKYIFVHLLTALVFLCILVALVDRKTSPLARSRVVFWIASTSYSVYLTHAIVLEIGFRIYDKTSFLPEVVHLMIILILCGIVGWVFYRMVEVPSLRLRHSLLPNRPQDSSPLMIS